MMTSPLCQDAMENLFGILSQMSGCNDHPTPTRFLIPINCSSFYSLARAPSGRSITQEVFLSNLLNHCASIDATDTQKKLDVLLDVGHLNAVHVMVKASFRLCQRVRGSKNAKENKVNQVQQVLLDVPSRQGL